MRTILIGDTIKHTWISSGSTPADIYASTYGGDETLINSVSMASSGNGQYYSFVSVNTPWFYVTEVTATIGGNPFKRRIKFEAVTGEVD